jgi:hypothetical protein
MRSVMVRSLFSKYIGAPVRTLVAPTLSRIGLELIKSKFTNRARVFFKGDGS